MRLMKLLKIKVVSNKYKIIQILQIIILGHEVVRLPVAHCELNPIEMAWSQVKGHVKDNNRKYTVI